MATTETQRRVLLAAYRQEGDLAARDRLVEDLMPVCRSIARRYAGRGEPLEDLVQVASLGLLKAIDGFDLERESALLSYVFPMVVGELKRHFRDRAWSVAVPRRLKELHYSLSRNLDAMTATLGRSPTIAELAEAVGESEEDVVQAMDAGGAYSAMSLHRGVAVEDGGELTPIDSLRAVEEGYEMTEDRWVIAAGLQALDERDRTVLHLRFFEGLTQSEIAVRVGISQMHVSRLIRRALATLRVEIEPMEEV